MVHAESWWRCLRVADRHIARGKMTPSHWRRAIVG